MPEISDEFSILIDLNLSNPFACSNKKGNENRHTDLYFHLISFLIFPVIVFVEKCCCKKRLDCRRGYYFMNKIEKKEAGENDFYQFNCDMQHI